MEFLYTTYVKIIVHTIEFQKSMTNFLGFGARDRMHITNLSKWKVKRQHATVRAFAFARK